MGGLPQAAPLRAVPAEALSGFQAGSVRAAQHSAITLGAAARRPSGLASMSPDCGNQQARVAASPTITRQRYRSDAIDLAVQPEALGSDEGLDVPQTGFDRVECRGAFLQRHGNVFTARVSPILGMALVREFFPIGVLAVLRTIARSEERRVGNECD